MKILQSDDRMRLIEMARQVMWFARGRCFALFSFFLMLLLTSGCALRGRDGCPLIVAHRAGARELGLTDSSAPAMRRALEDGLPMIEVDLRFSRDGKPFLFHDSRIIDRAWSIPSSLYGKRISMTNSSSIRALCSEIDSNVCILHLADALEIIGGSNAKMQIDLKGDISDVEIAQVVEMVRSRALLDQVVFFCDPVTEISRVRTMVPDVHILGRAYTEQEVQELRLIRPYAVQVDEDLLVSKAVRELKSDGILVMVKTLDQLGDTAEHWRRLAQARVDIILTDFPRAARSDLCPAASPH